MAKLKDGFYKLTAQSIGSDLLVLLAGGGSKPIADFALADGTNATGTWDINISGKAATVTCSASTSDNTRPIVVTNKSNGLYYSTKATLNYSTGNITAPTFTGALKGNADTATTASKLSTVSKTAWGLTYWTSGGIPTSISGDMTGVGNITIASGGNIDRFITFDTTSTRSWRIGYLGSGSGDANYLAFQSTKTLTTADGWHDMLKIGCETGNATFLGQVLAPNFVSGDGINDFSAGTVKLDVLNIPTSSGGTTFGPGSNGQVLKSNGTTVYWASDNNSNTWRPVSVNGNSVATNTTGTGTLNIVLGTGITVSGAVNSLTITNAGVRSVTIGTDTNANKVAVNTNGTTAYLTIPYATESNNTRYLQCPDTRSANIIPSSYSAGLSADFKSKSITGLTAAYAGVITFRPYSSSSDWTGGPIHNLAFDANGIHHRTASSDTWGSWRTILDSGNYTSYLGYIGTTAVQSSSATQALTGISRISNSTSAALYLGNSGNQSWVMTQDICSHSGSGNWAINIAGTAWFKNVNIGYTYNATSGYNLGVTGTGYISSTLTMGGGINTASTPGSWLSGMSGAAILYNKLTAIDATSFWRFFNMKSSGGNVVCYGGLGNDIGFYGYYSGRTANGTDWRFTVATASGNWTATASIYAAHFYENSDLQLKTNILEILNSDTMPIIKEFDWKEDGSHSYGLIAQELEEQGYSELVSTKDDGYKTVNYSAALSLIVGKLQVKIRELEKEIEILKNKN